MNWHKDKTQMWIELISNIQTDYGIDPTQTEKDTIQSMLLSRMNDCPTPFVFKGGTCLSKGYGIINRFSEDIDLSTSEPLTQGQRRHAKEYLISAANELGLRLLNPEQIRSRRDFNRYVFEYDSLYSDMPEQLIVEISYISVAYPVNTINIGSIVGKAYKNFDLSELFPEANIMMPAQTLERTFIDKVFAVCDYRLKDRPERNSRHLYDIYKLFPAIKRDDSFLELINKVRNERHSSGNCPSSEPDCDISALLSKIIKEEFFKNDYNTITLKLLNDNVSYRTAIDGGIRKVAESEFFNV